MHKEHPIKVAIVEDQAEVRESLRILIDGTQGYQCKWTFATAETALTGLPGHDIDVVIMDIHLSGMSGVEAIRSLRKVMAKAQFLVYTVFEDDESVFNALCSGATGYLLKRTPPSILLEEIRNIKNGYSPMSGEIARKVVESLQRGKQLSRKDAEELTEREIEILELLQKGLIYKEIADKLCISKDTVKKHIQHIYQKLQVQTRIEAVNKVFR